MAEETVVERTEARWTAATYTHPGGRPNNEDSVDLAVDGERACFALADGLGGHVGGERASRVAVDTALAHWRAHLGSPMRALLEGAVQAAHAAVRREQKRDPELADMRTTLTLLAIDGDRVGWAHVGDSRLYHFDDGRIAFQTKDHSVPQFLVTNGELDPSEIRHHPDRTRLLGTLGNDEDAVFPSVRELARATSPRDVFLLCSDGFWEDVVEAQMETALAAASGPRDWLERMVRLVEEVERKDRDNRTGCAVRFL